MGKKGANKKEQNNNINKNQQNLPAKPEEVEV
jgi:hypothetical protein